MVVFNEVSMQHSDKMNIMKSINHGIEKSTKMCNLAVKVLITKSDFLNCGAYLLYSYLEISSTRNVTQDRYGQIVPKVGIIYCPTTEG